MAILATQTGILMIPWIFTWITLLQVVIIGAENLDPVYFSFSANDPKNTSLIPLPKHFDKFGDAENDCCTLALFFKVEDLNMQGSGNDAPEMEVAQAQTGTGQATFKFEHPDIRDTDKIFTMEIAMDKPVVTKRHILNFDSCSGIIYKTFNISATTSITDEKDVEVILVNGKDKNIPCQVPHVPETIKPVSNTYSNSTEIPKAELSQLTAKFKAELSQLTAKFKAELSQLTVGLAELKAELSQLTVKAERSQLTVGLTIAIIVACVSFLASIVAIGAVAYLVKCVIPKHKTNNAGVRFQNEKCPVGGYESDDDQVKSPAVRGINRNAASERNRNGSDDSNEEEKFPVKSGDNVTTTDQLQKAEKYKKKLMRTAILCIILAIISAIVAIVAAYV